MTFDEFLNGIVRAGAVCAALVAIGLLLGRLLRWAVITPIKDLIHETVTKELQPNGGSSLRDVVNRIEKAQKVAQQETDVKHAENCASIASIARRLDDAGIQPES